MKNGLLLLCLSIFWIQSGISQNRPDFFKAIPAIDATTPLWAALMYSENPNVMEVENAYLEYYKTEPFKKNLHTQNYKHWRRKISPYLNQEGFIIVPDKINEDAKIKGINDTRKLNLRSAGTWRSLGPVETFEEGGSLPISFQVNVYCVDQSKSNKDILYVGTEGAGIYKTNDKGLSWELSSSEIEVTSVEAVQIHPSNPDIVFAAGNRRIFRTKDGGENWDEVEFIDASGYVFRFNPDNPGEIFCGASNGLYHTIDGGDSWQKVFSESIWDIMYHPSNPQIIYLLKNINGQNMTGLWKSSNGGDSWNQITQGWYQPENQAEAVEHGGKLGVTIADPDRVYAALIGDSKAGDSGWIGIFMSEDSGETWKQSASQIGGPYNEPNITPWNVAAYSDGYHQGYYNFGLGVSSINPNKIWVGTIRLSESVDAGKTFTAIGAANSIKHNKIHADIQAILVQDSEIWIASDGGLDYSNNELGSHQSRKYGITGADFWGFGSGWNEDVLVGGKYHNGNGVYYQTYGQGNFLHIGGVEEATGYVNPLDNRLVYTNHYWAGGTRVQRVPDLLSGLIVDLPQLKLIPNETYIESSSSGIYFDPRYSRHLYVGVEDGVWKSYNGGVSFEKLVTFDEGTVHEIAISRSNPDVLYCVVHTGGFWDGCSIYRTEDSGKTWLKVSNLAADRWRLEIDVHPENPMEIWVASSRGSNGAKVYQSLNGGLSWQNRTTSILNDQRMKDLIIQGGTENTIYLATDRGVFYFENNQWQPYAVNLPYALNSLSLKPFYRDNKLRLATYGRGIFETELAADFNPIAQAMTFSDSVLCSRDTIPFDCYSILNHEDAEWNWEFSPQPTYVSSTSSRNPKVVFGTPGTYSVILTVKDKQGRTSTYSNPEMIKVANQCSAEGIAGTSIELSGDGDYFQTSSLNTRTNRFTVTAWVYPDGFQPEYSGIFMNDDESAGFNFIGNNNTLGYHWPNGAWWWDSGLQVPANQWSYVLHTINSMNPAAAYLTERIPIMVS
ncbi:MAG: PKD domain-containing protein [Saprospiraceae bacterium]|nr:PKD domain-containing protein [Saprospiraceae bacterium]